MVQYSYKVWKTISTVNTLVKKKIKLNSKFLPDKCNKEEMKNKQQNQQKDHSACCSGSTNTSQRNSQLKYFHYASLVAKLRLHGI